MQCRSLLPACLPSAAEPGLCASPSWLPAWQQVEDLPSSLRSACRCFHRWARDQCKGLRARPRQVSVPAAATTPSLPEQDCVQQCLLGIYCPRTCLAALCLGLEMPLFTQLLYPLVAQLVVMCCIAVFPSRPAPAPRFGCRSLSASATSAGATPKNSGEAAKRQPGALPR